MNEIQLKKACEQGRKAGSGSVILSIAFSPLPEQNMKGDYRHFSVNNLFPILIHFLTVYNGNSVNKMTPAEKSLWISPVFCCFLPYSVNSCYLLEKQTKPDIGPKTN